MKFCTKCGTQLEDDAMFCSACGAAVGVSASASTDAPPAQTSVNAPPAQAPVHVPTVQPAAESGIKTIAKVFMLLSCIAVGIFLIPLAWMIPMTVVYWKKVSNHQPVGTGFKVCTLIFVNFIAGILMLCDDTPN